MVCPCGSLEKILRTIERNDEKARQKALASFLRQARAPGTPLPRWQSLPLLPEPQPDDVAIAFPSSSSSSSSSSSLVTSERTSTLRVRFHIIRNARV